MLAFPNDNIHVLFLLKNNPDQDPATIQDAAQLDKDAGWGARGTTLVDDEVLGRETYFGSGQVGTMILTRGFVIRTINDHDFEAELKTLLSE